MSTCACGKEVPCGWERAICQECIAKWERIGPWEGDSGKDARNDAIAGEYESRMAQIEGRDR